MEKIVVSLPRRLVRAATRAVRTARAPIVRTDAMAEKVKVDDLKSLLDEMLEETGGPPTKTERREADRILRGAKRHKKR